MGTRGRQSWIFVAAALLGGAVAVWAYLAWFTPFPLPRPSASAAPPAAAVAVAAAPAGARLDAEVQPVATTAENTLCAFDPLLARGNERDGQFALAGALALNRGSDPSPYLAVADEAAREGRTRDAEVALMAACRIAARAGTTSAPAADAQSRLAHHYATAAASQADTAVRAQLLERAEALLDNSVQGYTTALGRQSSRTRMAQQRLAALRQPTTRVVTVAVPEPTAPAPAENPAQLGAARLSLAERPVLHSESLGDLEHDLERLYTQARAVSRDPAGLQRRQQQALAQRDACGGNEDCLRNWYSQRKRALFAEF